MISYIGGKARIGKWITPFIPTDIETYVEPFSGMFWVFFNMNLEKYPNLKTVVYNDFNGLNANLFKCAKDYDKLYELLVKYPRQPFSKDTKCNRNRTSETNPLSDPKYPKLFEECQNEVFSKDLILADEPNFDIACKYIYVLTQVFSGSKPETSKYTDYKGKYRSKVDIFEDKLKDPKFREHLDRITFVHSKDFEEVMKIYDSPTTYFYLDPPYWKTENYYSAHDFDSDDHSRLAGYLHNIKGKFGLSYYDFPKLSEWLPEGEKFTWVSKEFAKAAAAKDGVPQNMGKELLIMNYKPNVVIKEKKWSSAGNREGLEEKKIDEINTNTPITEIVLDSKGGFSEEEPYDCLND